MSDISDLIDNEDCFKGGGVASELKANCLSLYLLKAQRALKIKKFYF